MIRQLVCFLKQNISTSFPKTLLSVITVELLIFIYGTKVLTHLQLINNINYYRWRTNWEIKRIKHRRGNNRSAA